MSKERPFLADLVQAFANVDSAAAIVDGQPIVEILGAAIDQPAAGEELRPVDLGVAPAGRGAAQLEVIAVAVHAGQVVDELRLVTVLRHAAPSTKP
jgi:hypothetical protein